MPGSVLGARTRRRRAPRRRAPAARDGQRAEGLSALARGGAVLGAYDQGVQALASLGDPDVVDCALRRYVHDNSYRTAAPSDLLGALLTFFPNARQKLEAYGASF